MKMPKALLATAAGSVVALTATLVIAGEDYCDIEGPDIITYKVADSFGNYDFDHYGYDSEEDIVAFAVASTSGNPGDMISQWTGDGGEYSPVIGCNVYRLKDNRFEHIGLSWLKHSFCAVSEAMCNCQQTGCSNLGVGCADTYWAGLNADADAPRSEIDATRGQFEYPFFQSPCGPSSMRGKIQIAADDCDPALNAGARYFVEVQYVAPDSDPDYPDEYEFDNQHNNASYREIKFNSTTSTQPIGETVVMQAAIHAWGEAGATVTDVWTPEGDGFVGLMHLGFMVTDNGDGTWHYEYAVHNQNSHESAGSFSIPISPCVEITNVGFTDADYHSCEMVHTTDWDVEVTENAVTWYTESHEWANSIRWASMYSFRFDANYPPSSCDALIGLWRSGVGEQLEVSARGPLPDCNDDCPADLNQDGLIDVNDVLLLIGYWNGNQGDVDGDGDTDVNDLLEMLEVYATSC